MPRKSKKEPLVTFVPDSLEDIEKWFPKEEPPLAAPGISKEQIEKGKAQGIGVEELQSVLDGYRKGVSDYGVDEYLDALRDQDDELDVEDETDAKRSLSSPDSKKGARSAVLSGVDA
jgi:hypothetical protein